MQDEWIFSAQVRTDQYGTVLEPGDSKFILIDDCSSLSCTIQAPLDAGEALVRLYKAIEKFMPDNTIACLASIASCAMGASYEVVVSTCGHMGVPFEILVPASPKLHSVHSQSLEHKIPTFSTTRPLHHTYLMQWRKPPFHWPLMTSASEQRRLGKSSLWMHTTILLGELDPTKSSVSSLSRWCLLIGCSSTRCVLIPFALHTDEPEATQLYADLAQARSEASASVGQIISMITSFSTAEEQRIYCNEIFPSPSIRVHTLDSSLLWPLLCGSSWR